MATARFLVLASALLLPASAFAAGPIQQTPGAAEHRLSPEEVEKILEEAARRREGTSAGAGTLPMEPEAPRPSVRGEVGFAIGTGGYRSAYGTAVVDLPGDGAAIVSIGTQRLPVGPGYYPGW